MALSEVSACTGKAGKLLSDTGFPRGRIFLAISDSGFMSGCGEAGVPDGGLGFPLLLTSIKLPTCSATFGKLLFFFSGSVSPLGEKKKKGQGWREG